MGIYKRKQESKKTRKQELDQESDQEKKKAFKKTRKYDRDRFLGRVLFFIFSHFLVFFYKFSPQEWFGGTLVAGFLIIGICINVETGEKERYH